MTGILPGWLVVAAFALQLYFDFSGYTDIVLGVSTLFGVRLPGNFNNPYLATNPAQFWERWHMSLSMWFRQYLFFPLSRVLLRRFGAARRGLAQLLATMSTMILIGLWHGAGWNFVAWGALHGAALAVHAWWKQSGRSLPVQVGRILLLGVVLVGWAVFMSADGGSMMLLLSQMFGLGGIQWSAAVQWALKPGFLPAMTIGVLLIWSGRVEAAALSDLGAQRTAWRALGWGVLAAVCVLLRVTGARFLYIQF
jgi:D-alanyl-lipoteichoic acid acyltransferase DltB (MBOAT superfamily)